MRGDELLDKLDLVDPAYLEEAEAAPAGRRPWARPALIAACLCLALVGTAVAAWIQKLEVSDVFWFEYEQDGDKKRNQGFRVEGGVDYIPLEDLSEEALKLLAEGRSQKDCADWSAAEDFLGIELADNPVLDRALVEKEQRCTVHLRDRRENNDVPYFVEVWAKYLLPAKPGAEKYGSILTTGKKPKIWSSAQIFRWFVSVEVGAVIGTEEAVQGEDPIARDEIWWVKNAARREEYTTPSGLETVLMEVYGEGGDISHYLAFFTLNGARFRVIASHDGDQSVTLETLKQVLDGFE